MPTVLRLDGLSFRIYPADHEPPRVHVFRAGMQAKILLPRYSNLRRARAIVDDHREELRKAWSRYHGQ